MVKGEGLIAAVGCVLTATDTGYSRRLKWTICILWTSKTEDPGDLWLTVNMNI